MIAASYIIASLIAAGAAIYTARGVGKRNGKGSLHTMLATHMRQDAIMFRLILKNQGVPPEEIDAMINLAQREETDREASA